MHEPPERPLETVPAPPSGPTPVTGVISAPQTGLLIALAVVVAVLAASGLGLVGFAVISRSAGLLERVGPPARAPVDLESELRRRAEADYPGFRVEDLTVTEFTDVEGRTAAVSVLLSSRAEPGFALEAIYSAPATAGAAASFHNDDTFFTDPGNPRRPVDSFIAMWVRHHPGTVCEYVLDMGDDGATVRRLLAAGAERSKDGGLPLGEDTIYYYDWDADADTWTLTTQRAWDERDDALEAAIAAAADAAEAEAPSFEDYVESTEPIPVLVRKLLPGFDYRGAMDMGDGSDYALLRHKRYPATVLVVEEASLQVSPHEDGALEVLEGETARGTAFSRAWAAAHPGAVIWVIAVDPDYIGDKDAAMVTYFDSMASTKGTAVPDKSLCRYDPKTGKWTVGR